MISRNRKLWNREATGKILAKIDVDEGETMKMWERALAPGTCPDYRKMFDVFLQDFQRCEFLRDDAVPTARPNIGDYGFGVYVGAEVIFGEGGAYAKESVDQVSRGVHALFCGRLIEPQRRYIQRFDGGYFDLHEEWLPGDCVWLSIDAWGQCSPQVFRDLGKNHLQKMVDHFGTGWLHMHNSQLHLLEEVETVKGLVGIGILDDPKQVPCFERLVTIQEVTGDIPLQINCRKEQFLASLDQGTLPRNVMYWIDSGVESVDEANAIMERVYQY